MPHITGWVDTSKPVQKIFYSEYTLQNTPFFLSISNIGPGKITAIIGGENTDIDPGGTIIKNGQAIRIELNTSTGLPTHAAFVADRVV